MRIYNRLLWNTGLLALTLAILAAYDMALGVPLATAIFGVGALYKASELVEILGWRLMVRKAVSR